jgi:hypothetical protein
MLSPLHTDIFAINCLIKKKIQLHNNPSCTYSTSNTNFHWMTSAIVLILYYTLTLKSLELGVSVIFYYTGCFTTLGHNCGR